MLRSTQLQGHMQESELNTYNMKKIAILILMLFALSSVAQKRMFDTIGFIRGGTLYKLILYNDSLQINAKKYYSFPGWQAMPVASESLFARVTGATNNIYNINSGNVGIGTTNPTQKLTVSADIQVNSIKIGQGNYVNNNVAIGPIAAMPLSSNVSGAQNVAIGVNAAKYNNSGTRNVVIGCAASLSNLIGGYNTSIGYMSLWSDTSSYNTGIGSYTGRSHSYGGYNTYIGSYAGDFGGTKYNTAVGSFALWAAVRHSNTAIGYGALQSADYNCVGIGDSAGLRTITNAANLRPNKSIYIGHDSKASADSNTNEIVIGSTAEGNGSNTATIGNSSITDTYIKGILHVGNGVNNITIDTTNSYRMYGSATVWDDLAFESSQLKSVGNSDKPDYDVSNLGLLFPQNDTTERVGHICQMPHRWKEGSSIYPHVHWIQSGADSATWKIKYRVYSIGEAVPSAWTIITSNNHAVTYSSGNIQQLATFPAISMTGKTISCIVDIILYRKDNILTGDALMKFFDIHFEVDGLGSKDELSK